MKIYTYEPSGALVTYIGYSEESEKISNIVHWPEQSFNGEQPAFFDIYNAKSKLPDIFEYKRTSSYVSRRVYDVFKAFDPEGTDYLPIIARGPLGKAKSASIAEFPYWGVYAKAALDCVDESRSVYIASEWPCHSGKWSYEDIEILKFREDVIQGYHHFRIKGWNTNSFISEELAKALKALPRSNLRIRPVDEVFRISRYNDYPDPMKSRNSNQGYFYRFLEEQAEKGVTVNFRRRNKNDP